jgi:two-component system CheB/CheR fusion protein
MNTIEPHHIIAIGASAGGLDELISFFENTPLDGVCYVVVQHLSSDYESRLTEVLSGHSRLTMITAGDGMILQTNCVYVIPGNKFMSVKGGRLYLSDKITARGPHLTINTFFCSLASDYRQKAIGIILSGLGSDGSLGVKAIKKAGGMVIARNPETTEFSSMPSNAVATGIVDFILEPESMPDVIEDYIKREIELLVTNISDEEGMAELIELIHQQLPLDFSDYKQTTILRRIKRRAAYNNFERLRNYFDFAKGDPLEIEALAKDFLISVTAFFRDPEAFTFVEQRVLPAIMASLTAGQEIRIWVTGCATGEEAYSMAIMVSELLEGSSQEHQVKIFATDIDVASLAHAAKGVYSEATLARMSPSYIQKYFVAEVDQYKVTAHIRRMVIFARHDLVKNPPYCNIHLISCRNLLIYMTPTLQKKIYQMLLFGLQTDGYLFLGSSENPLPIIESLAVADKKWKVYQKLDSSPAVSFEAFSIPEYSQPISSLPGTTQQQATRNSDRTLDGAINETIFSEEQRLIICIDETNRVLKSYGPTEKFLFQKNFTADLAELLPGPLLVAFKAIRAKVNESGLKDTVTGIIITQAGQNLKVDLSVSPMLQNGRRNGFMVVQFTEQTDWQQQSESTVFDQQLYLDKYSQTLENENGRLREQLAAANEKLFSLNENMQSFNEELLSANEEMQSTNEEMQSVNEELHTINADYELKNKKLLELNDDLNNYFRSNTNGQLFVSDDLRLIRFSPGTVRLINLLESDTGRPLSNISTNFRYETLTEDIRQMLEDGLTITREVQTHDGKWYQVMTMPYIQQISGQRVGAVVTFNDVSELKTIQLDLDRKNEVLMRINQDLDNFVHTTSHDLLAPLGHIEASISIMNQQHGSFQELEPFLEIINMSVHTFRGLINDIAAVAKIEDQAILTEAVDLHDIMDNIQWSLSDKINQNNATIKRDFKISHIQFSKKNLRSILFNLVSNGIKYRSDRDPVIIIEALTKEDYIKLSVHDNGAGIGPSGLSKIFEKYGRILTEQEGQGIGLYLARKIIDAAGGNIRVESTPGVGSTFIINLPVTELSL